MAALRDCVAVAGSIRHVHCCLVIQDPPDDAPETAPQAPAPRWRRYGPKLVVSLLIAGGLGWLLHVGALPVLPDARALAATPVWLVPAYVAVVVLLLLVRAARWYWLLAAIAPVPMGRVLAVGFIFFGALVLLPFRLGEAVRPAVIREPGRLSAWAVAGTAGAERIVDGLVLSAMLLLGLVGSTPLDPLPDHIGKLPIPVAVIPSVAYTALAVFAGAFVAMGLFYWRRGWARSFTRTVFGVVSPRFAAWLAERVEHVSDGLRFLADPRHGLPVLIGTLLYWGLSLFGTWLVLDTVGLDGITAAQAAVVLGVLSLGILLPNAPGFFGTFQISVYAALAMFHDEQMIAGAGSVAVFYLYVVQIGVALVGGAVGLFTQRRRLGLVA
jgi:hypothetical protein